MKDENKMTSWQDKRINEINKICNTKPIVAEDFIDEVNDIYKSKADSYEEFVKEQEEKKSKYERKEIKRWRNLK